MTRRWLPGTLPGVESKRYFPPEEAKASRRDPRQAMLVVLMLAGMVVGFFDSVATGILGVVLVAAFFLTLPIGDE